MKLTNEQVWLLLEVLKDSLEVDPRYNYVFRQPLKEREKLYAFLIKEAVLNDDGNQFYNEGKT